VPPWAGLLAGRLIGRAPCRFPTPTARPRVEPARVGSGAGYPATLAHYRADVEVTTVTVPIVPAAPVDMPHTAMVRELLSVQRCCLRVAASSVRQDFPYDIG
jgi:hypothetical protein